MTFKVQNENIAKLVLTMVLSKMGRLEALEEASRRITEVNQPCRMETVFISPARRVYLDVCHNESGMKAALKEIK